MNCKTALALVAGLLILASPSWAQQDTMETDASRPEQTTPPRLDIIPMGGYVWTVSQSATYNLNSGDIDFESGGFYGLAVDIYAMPFMQVRLLYRRQDTKLTFKWAGVKEDLGDVGIEYWHVGGVKGVQNDKVKPFTSLSLGGTRYVYDGGDEWKFSAILGLGAKIYLNDKIGIMATGQMPFTFTSAFLGIGTGGLSIGGSGIAQFDLAAGLMITI